MIFRKKRDTGQEVEDVLFSLSARVEALENDGSPVEWDDGAQNLPLSDETHAADPVRLLSWDQCVAQASTAPRVQRAHRPHRAGRDLPAGHRDDRLHLASQQLAHPPQRRKPVRVIEEA